MSVFGVIQSECRKMQTKITPNTDTFYAVNAWLCLNMSGYAKIWILLIGFCLTFPHCNPLSTWTHGYIFPTIVITFQNIPFIQNGKTESPFLVIMFQRSLWSEGRWDCFLKKTKFDFFYSSWKYLTCFLLWTPYIYK